MGATNTAFARVYLTGPTYGQSLDVTACYAGPGAATIEEQFEALVDSISFD
ncbi:MAG: hypothetical protein JO147_08185 [Actinobacteria bacterium]|nr:hypothetical protein [Actinomycetota bacterium]